MNPRFDRFIVTVIIYIVTGSVTPYSGIMDAAVF